MQYSREKNGRRFTPGSMVTNKALDMLASNEYSFLQNVRAYLMDRWIGRATQSSPAVTVGFPPHTVRRLNDSTPAGPGSGYALITGAAGSMYVNATQVAHGFSGNPVSLNPFRPNASVQPWMYVGDSAAAVTLDASGFVCPGSIKIRSDGLTYKRGIAEPQVAPVVSTTGTSTTGTDSLPATTIPWTNVSGANPSYNYGHTSGGDGTSPVIIATPVGSQTLKLVVTGSATVNGASHSPGDTGPTGATFPANFTGSGPKIVLGAFTDGSGNVLTGTSPVPLLANVGAGITLQVPASAVQFQIGIDSSANTFSANSGSFSVVWTLVTSAIATKVSTLGNVTAYYWGDSPHSGPVAEYIWRNPNDSGTGLPRTIGDAAGSVSNNSWQFHSSPADGTVPVQWDSLDSSGTVIGSNVLFSPSLETQGYQDFNVAIVGSLFIPAAGTYSFTFVNKDQIMVGVGGGATVSGGYVLGPFGQTVSVVNSLPLVYVSTPSGGGGAVTQTISITFPGSGSYQIEIGWDYWFHTGRGMTMTVNSAVIPPLPQGVRTNVSYACKYRSSITGAPSNPGPASTPQLTPVLNNTVSCVFSPDPQVDKVDYYRQDSGLANYTYVATGPNTNPPTAITDTLSDLAAAANPIMQTDDFEPFPSIDLPRAGVVNVTGGVITWVSGDQFNIRWLAGTVILIGSPTQLAYSFIARPTSTTTVAIPGVPDGTNLVYNIAEPILAAQPLPSLWGPTDNTAYMFACYDFLRPGTLYYTKGNNPDSAPDTNQIEVTSPSEPLMNGVIVNGIGMVFSTERAWLIYPTFTTALATVSGVQGQAFNLIESVTNRGLYIRTAICTEAGKNVFFRAKDGIYVSPGGAGSESLTDAQIFNLFPHEGVVPQPIVIGGYTISPPDDTRPNAQTLAFSDGYLYYDYQDVSGTPRTLVYDVAAKGWSTDAYGAVVTVHALEEGQQVNGTLVGCVDNTVRTLSGGAAETAISVVATGAMNSGDARAFKRIGDVFIKALAQNANPIALALYANRYATALAGYAPTSLTGTGALSPYVIDFTAGFAQDVIDIEAILSWNTASGDYIDFWEPNWISLPESIQDQPSDWDDCGSAGNKFVQGFLLECNSYNAPKTFGVQRSDDLSVFSPVEVPFTANGQTIRSFTFATPFVAHMIRRVSTDNVPWQAGPSGGWRLAWVVQPYPEASTSWTTEGTSNNMVGYQSAYQLNLAYIASSPVTFTMTTDEGTFTAVFPATSEPSLLPAKILQKLPRNKWKTISYSLTSSVAFYVWRDLTELWVKSWGDPGPFQKIQPFGNQTGEGAAI